jgi:uncharacterized membrane protein YkoI
MRRRLVLAVIVAVAVVLAAGAALAVGGGSGLIWDDGHYAKPGSLDDGKTLLPQTTISLSQAVANARAAATGAIGQVDLERDGSRIVYMVDVGDHEVRVDAADGNVVSVTARD